MLGVKLPPSQTPNWPPAPLSLQAVRSHGFRAYAAEPVQKGHGAPIIVGMPFLHSSWSGMPITWSSTTLLA